MTTLTALEAKITAIGKRRAKERAKTNLNALDAAMSKYAAHPVEYVNEYLGKQVTPKQAEILTKLELPPYRVLARSANTQGKTFIGAAKCSHFYDTYNPSLVLVTAPVYEQVRDLAFKELRSLRPNLRGFLPKATRLESSLSHYVNGLTANKPDSFQGRHDEHIGLWFDEATGIAREFWSRADTMFVGANAGSWWLATYNPNDAASHAFAAEESGSWHLVVLSALEHPNILAELAREPPPIPAAIRLDTVLRRFSAECDKIAEQFVDPIVDFEFPVGSGLWWHPRTSDFEAQILGRWPVSPATALWSPALFDQCCMQIEVDPSWTLAVGCDVARFGDDKSCIFARIGPVSVLCEAYSGVTTTWLAQRLREVCLMLAELVTQLASSRPARSTSDSPLTMRQVRLATHSDARSLARRIPCYIDDTGGYGAGVIDQNDGYAFVGVCMSSASSDPRFPNLRSQLWCQFADAAISGRGAGVNFAQLSFEDRRVLKGDLTSAHYSLNPKNQRVVEPKVHIKERLGRSPDRADAAILCFSMIGEG